MANVSQILGIGVARLASLAPPRLYLQTPAGVETPPSGRGRRYWVVARSLCRFFRIAVPAGPRARQLDMLALELKRLSPFAETGSHVHLGAAHAAIWLWDRDAVRAAASAIGLDIGRVRIVPEAALQPPGDDGLRLIETLEGVEAQYWSDGSLAASRWWREMPDERAWLMFQRGASVPADRLFTQIAKPRHLSWLTRPWTTSRSGVFALSSVDVRAAMAVAAATILLLCAYQGAEWLRLSGNAARLATEAEQRSAAIEPLLNARTAALDNQAAIQTLRGLDRFPGQVALMARVTEVLPPGRTHLTAWVYDRGQLELGIASDQPLDVVTLVRALEGIQHVKSVAAERTGTDNSLRLRVMLEPL